MPEGQELRPVGATSRELLALADWKPVYNLLEGYAFTRLLVNARHMKAVQGRKTDIRDAEWIADLLRHGRLKGSFVPDRAQRELRALSRYRRRLSEQRAQLTNRVQKVLEGANIKLAHVASEVMGASGRAMLEALVQGEQDPEALAELAKGKLTRKRAELPEALVGVIAEHQRFLRASLLRHASFLDEEIARLHEEVAEHLSPFGQALEQLATIPGVGRRAAAQILAAITPDMSRFPSAKHLASWARVCPGKHESAGKRQSGRSGSGNRWLRAILVDVAHAAGRTKNT